MRRYKKVLAAKILLLLILLSGGVAAAGCTGALFSQVGWSGATVVDGSLFFGATGGKLVALDTSNGNLLWSEEETFKTQGSGGFLGCAPQAAAVAFYGTPAVSGELVYISGYNGKVYAFNTASGALRWVYPREGSLAGPIIGGPVVSQGMVYIGSDDGMVYALDAATGDSVWQFEIGDKIWSTPVVYGNTLFIGSSDKKLYALDATTGQEKWQQPFEAQGPIVSTPLVYNDMVYVASFDRHLYALDAISGELIWTFPSDDADANRPQKWFWASPVVYDNTIYAPSMDGRVYVLDAESGILVTSINLDGAISSSPVVVDGKVIVVTEEGKIYSIDTANNQKSIIATLRTSQDKEAKIYAPLSASNGLVYIHSQEGVLYEVDVQTRVARQLYPIG